MWVNVWLFQFIPLQPIDNQRFAKPVKDVGFLYENSRRQENAESMILFRPLDYDVGCQSLCHHNFDFDVVKVQYFYDITKPWLEKVGALCKKKRMCLF